MSEDGKKRHSGIVGEKQAICHLPYPNDPRFLNGSG
jgi:hypothetical protein